ncbi:MULTISPECIES: DUF7502 family protein [Halomicrobium]|uniref:Uncharacterized protein n=2 Tax=Halomicrobium mukohataei TaxID=57705 RepID=C7P315_HALMD|nr:MULTISPECIES: hypothetical protein [Halomicrobium]ACV47487.1 conserved hypothetical protein [Halomicrobium mukohataei DSM 12286]QCD65951.1 hypothetical protein E5139_09990 [Halomicrobium mukohataei]QFR20756.1 hypothetical protein GBQ70_09985 [Halomicrobium sp. ZPS1]
MDGLDTDTGERSGQPPTEERERARERMAAAIAEVRYEGKKAAFVYAVVDAVLVALLANVVLTALSPAGLPTRVSVPAAMTEPIGAAVGRSIPALSLPAGAVVGIALGGGWLLGEYLYRVRQPLVEQFEAANANVTDALRTARDAVEDGAETRMAARLYEDVLAGLKQSSSTALVDSRRLAGTLVVVLLVSLATVQVAVVDVSLLDRDPVETESTDDGPDEYGGLEDGDAILGDSEDVQAGEENLTAEIDSTGGDQEVDRSQEFPSSDTDGPGSASGTVDSRQAGFAGQEEIEDAALVREYNLRIRERDADDGDTDQ